MTNYNINFCKSTISTSVKGNNSAGHFQGFRVSKCQQFSFTCRKNVKNAAISTFQTYHLYNKIHLFEIF